MQRLLVIGAGLALVAAACTQTPDVIVETPPAEIVVQSPSETVERDLSDGEDETSSLGIAVGGRGRVTGIPDTLQIQMGVTVSRRSVADAMQEAADLADALLAVLDGEGVAEQDIQTREFSIFPEYDYQFDRERLIGYQVTNLFEVTVRDLDAASSVIGAAAATGGDAIRIRNVRFVLEDDRALVQEARRRRLARRHHQSPRACRLGRGEPRIAAIEHRELRTQLHRLPVRRGVPVSDARRAYRTGGADGGHHDPSSVLDPAVTAR